MTSGFKDLESSLKEELTETFFPPLIKRLVEETLTDTLKDGYIRKLISGHVLDQINSVKTDVQNTETQLNEISQELRRAERERDTYNTRLKTQLNILMHILDLQLNQINNDPVGAKKTVTGPTEVSPQNSTTTYPKATTASSDLTPTNTDPPAPVTTEVSDQDASNSTAPPAPVTAQDSDLHVSTSPSQALSPSSTITPAPVTTQGLDLPTTQSQADRDLFNASRDGDLARVKQILENEPVNINTRGGWRRRTAVLEAARWGHRDVVEFLVARGADASLLGKYGRNILHYACWSGDVETVKLILSLKVVGINSRGWMRKTPVMTAAGEGKGEVVELLVRRGAELSPVDVDGSNILFYAAKGGDMKAVKLILSRNIVDINAKNDYGHTAAYFAMRRGHQQVLDYLESLGAH
ncbi:ankyrin repeat and SOCS box protein 2-like [Haliotis asinina]|uniref:ankyrin repeat and SOCS box protein 2-like n=1 Tax=Haliotis asinina TaxID=109174 RepID=UPI003531FFD0